MSDHVALPRTDRTAHPPRYLLHPLRPLARWIIRRPNRGVVHHPERDERQQSGKENTPGNARKSVWN